MTTKLAIAILIILVSPCFAGTIELDQTGDKSQIQVYVQKSISGKVGAYIYSCQTKGFGETHTGLTYAPVRCIQISAGVGLDTNGTRVAGSVWAGKGRVSGIYFLENGPGGTWDKLVLRYQVTNSFALGYTKKQYAGNGVYADFKANETITIKYSGFKTPELALQLSF